MIPVSPRLGHPVRFYGLPHAVAPILFGAHGTPLTLFVALDALGLTLPALFLLNLVLLALHAYLARLARIDPWGPQALFRSYPYARHYAARSSWDRRRLPAPKTL